MLVFPLLKTRRLILRKLSPDDFDALVKQANNKKISDQIINIPHPYELHHAVHRINYAVKGFDNKSRFVFVIALAASNELIGEISLHLQDNMSAELGYWIGEFNWNKGFATEAIEAIVIFGFETLKLKMIYATCSNENVASALVLQKNNFLCEEKINSIHTYVRYST